MSEGRRRQKRTARLDISRRASSHVELFIEKLAQAESDLRNLFAAEVSLPIRLSAVEQAKNRLRTACQEALGHAFMAIEPSLRSVLPAPTNLDEDSLRISRKAVFEFLTDALVFSPEFPALNRELAHPPAQGGPATLGKLVHMAQAVRLCDLFFEEMTSLQIAKKGSRRGARARAIRSLSCRGIEIRNIVNWRPKVLEALQIPIGRKLLHGNEPFYPRARTALQRLWFLRRDLLAAYTAALTNEKRATAGL